MDKVTIALYFIGCIFLGLAAKVWYEAKTIPDEKKYFLAVDEPFDFQMLVTTGGYDVYGASSTVVPEHILAIYTMPPERCANCLNDVRVYSRLFEEQGFEGKPVQNKVVVVATDRRQAARFAKTADFQVPVMYGYDALFGPRLPAFGTTTVPRQLLLIEPATKRLFFRARLASGSPSSPEAREEILHAAQKAYDALSR
ncbi:MAG: hypothetical protein ACE5G0_11195 [Rhodothermales bacterium]